MVPNQTYKLLHTHTKHKQNKKDNLQNRGNTWQEMQMTRASFLKYRNSKHNSTKTKTDKPFQKRGEDLNR